MDIPTNDKVEQTIDSILNNEIKADISKFARTIMGFTRKDVENSTEYVRKEDARKYVLENDKNIWHDVINESRKNRQNILDAFNNEELCEYVASPYNVSYNTLFDALYNYAYNISPKGNYALPYDEDTLERIKRFYDLLVEKRNKAE